MAKKNKTMEPLRVDVTCPRDPDSEYGFPDPNEAKYYVIPQLSIEGARGASYVNGEIQRANERYCVAIEQLTEHLASEHGLSPRDCTWLSAHERVVETAREVGRHEGMSRIAAEYRGEFRGMNHRFWMGSRHKDLCRMISHQLSVGVMTRMLKRGVSLSEFAAALEMGRKEALRRLRVGDFDVNHVGAMTGVLEWDVDQVLGQLTKRRRPAA